MIRYQAFEFRYIGYLITCGINIIDIYKEYDNKQKDQFLERVKEKVRSTVNDVSYRKKGDDVTFDLEYPQHREPIQRLLLLFNIEYMIKHNKNSENWYMRFPFDLYKKQKWDIEHINSYSTNEITKRDDQIIWIDTAVKDLKSLSINIEQKDPDLAKQIEAFKSNNNDNFVEIKKRIALCAKEDVEEDDNIKNSLGNLTLLNADINRAYRNSLFVTKRKFIIKKDKEGCFIPICTKHVFLKYYDMEGTSKTIWTKENGDHNNYLCQIIGTLGNYINYKEEE